jgi:hypothetical protein
MTTLGRGRLPRGAAPALVLLAALAAPAAAVKIDVVGLRNGDRLPGEADPLEPGAELRVRLAEGLGLRLAI